MKKTATLALTVLSLIIVGFILGQSTIQTQAQTNVETSTYITSSNPVYNNSLVHVRVEIDPAPPTKNDRFTNFTFTAIRPDGYEETKIKNIAGTTMIFTLGGGVFDSTFNLTWIAGTWTLKINFLGQTFSNGKYYLPSENETTFTVIPTSRPTPKPPPSPMDILISGYGSVSPSNAPIQRTNNLYYLTSDVTGSITILASNLIFDGNGHSLNNRGTGVGGLVVGCDYYSPLPTLTKASNVTVKNLVSVGSVFGISVIGSSNCLIMNNTVLNTGNSFLSLDEQTAGIYIEGGASNIIRGNSLSNNYDGMLFLQSSKNLIVENSIADCSNPTGYSSFGIQFWGASNNTIYHNDFINNAMQAYGGIAIAAAGVAPLSNNIWDDGFPNGGNYWSDYQTKYTNASMIDDSGIGNTPYVIDKQNNTDKYPLMEPFAQFFKLATTPPKITVQSALNQNQFYNGTDVSLNFTVDKEIDWMGYSLDRRQNVTLSFDSPLTNGTMVNITLVNMANGSHSIKVYANDTFGNMGTSENISFSVALAPLHQLEYPSIFTFSAILGMVGLAIGLLVYFKKSRFHSGFQ